MGPDPGRPTLSEVDRGKLALNAVKFFSELKRRRVYSVAVTYVVAGWIIIQVVTQVFPPFEIPNWAERLVIVLVVAGFPVALVLAWVYDFTRHGIERTKERIEATGPASAEQTAAVRSIAILPFHDLSPNRDHDYFSDGIAEEILIALSKIEGLHVAARRSSFWFKGRDAELTEIAQKLNVENVLEGSVRRDGNRVRIAAELINASDGFTIWSETFDREFQGIFAVQDEITSAIVDALRLKLEISVPSVSRSTEAYDIFLQGLFYSDKSTEEALRRSLELFERALEKDPNFSRAWTGIAKAWLWLADAYVAPVEAYPKVREAAKRALELDEREAEAHVYLGETKRILDWDLDGAAAEFARAVELDPNSTPSNYFSASLFAQRGDREQALKYLERTSKIDPASLWVSNFACELYRYFGLYEEAIVEGERSLLLDPTFLYGPPPLAIVYRVMGRYEEAIALYKKASGFTGRPGIGLAIVYALIGRREEALEALNATVARRTYTPGDAIAHVHLALGDYEKTIEFLERACDERSSNVHNVGITPEYAPLRSDQRFLSILRRIGIDPEKAFAASAKP
jgi:adenylate cyclase